MPGWQDLENLLNDLEGSRPIPKMCCKNGLELSVQANVFTYCSPKDNKGPYTHVEVGFPSQKVPELLEYAEDPEDPTGTIYGYVPIEIVRGVILSNGGLDQNKTEKSHIKLLWGNENACVWCGNVITGWALSDPSNCGDPHPDCPVFGIGQEAYDKMAEEVDRERKFKEEFDFPEGFRFLEIED